MTNATTAPLAAPYTATSTSIAPMIVAVGGRDSVGVLRVARDLASAGDRETLAVTVLEPYPQYVSGLEPMILPPSFETERAERRLSVLRDRLRDIGGPATTWRAQVIHGIAGSSLAELATSINAGLIVVGIGRHLPLDRLLGSETSLQVVKHAPCPVLAVVPGAKAPFHHAVVATDFGPASACAAEAAMSLLGPGATVSLVHSWQPAPRDDEQLAKIDRIYAEGLPERFQRFREAIHIPAGVTVKDVLHEGTPAESILGYATAHHADLLVAGRRKLHLLTRLAVGSVTTAILRGATRSVLITPEPSFGETDRLRRLLSGRSETHEPAQWVVQLRGFTARNHGRRVSLEVDDLTVGAQVVETGYRLIGVGYEPGQRRVELVVGATGDDERRITRRIVGVEQVTVIADAHGRDTALQVLHGPGLTVLSFMDN